MTKVVVLGGGVSGLTSAFLTKKALDGAKASIQLVEACNRTGGWFSSEKRKNDGVMLEKGPHSFRPVGDSGTSVVRLLEELGLEKQAIGTSDVAKQRYLWVDGKMNELPTSISGMLANPVTKPLPFAGLREAALVRKRAADDDESIHDFFSRRFSPYVAETFADGMVQGIFAGDPKQLSIEACFPLLKDLENSYGSVVRGVLLRSLFKPKSNSLVKVETKEGQALLKKTGVSFPGGLETLTKELEHQTFCNELTHEATKTNLIIGDPVVKINKDRTVELESGAKLNFDYLISAMPLPALRQALPEEESVHLEEAERRLNYASVGVINLIYDNMERLPLPGFGHLVPTKDGSGILGMIYDSEVFPAQQTENRSALTVMIGGAKFPHMAKKSKEEMIQFAIEKAREHLDINAKPSVAIATVHQDCIPQYGIGHMRLIEEARSSLLESMPYLRIIGNNFQGVGIADSVANARKAVNSLDLSVHLSFK